jgi:hypothetical protein
VGTSMHASLPRPSVRLGLLAAIIVAATICVFVGIRLAVSPHRAPGSLNAAQPRSQSEGFRLATHKKSALREAYDKLHPDKKKRVEEALQPVRAHIRLPTTMRLNRESEVILVVGAGGETEVLPGRSIPVDVKVVENAATFVSAWLSPFQTDAEVKPRPDGSDAKRAVEPHGQTRWTWIVTPKEPGDLTLELFSSVNSDDGGVVEYPDAELLVPIVVSWSDRALYFVGEAGSVGQLLTALVTALTTIGGVIGLLYGFGIRLFGPRVGAHRAAPEDSELRT